jgi:signal transduction histidine kinase
VDESFDRLIAAEQDERRRLALSLHDGPVQNLSGIALMIDAALHSLDAGDVGDARNVLEAALERQRETVRDLRNLSFGLEPVVLRDQGLGPALRELTLQIGTMHALQIDVDIDAAEELGQSAQIALYTIVRELLEETVRRGPASRISIAMRRLADGGLETVLVDDAEPERRRRSLEAIEERVTQLHGQIKFDAAPGTGTRVTVTLPPYATRR